jgi:hypothetical protein
MQPGWGTYLTPRAIRCVDCVVFVWAAKLVSCSLPLTWPLHFQVCVHCLLDVACALTCIPPLVNCGLTRMDGQPWRAAAQHVMCAQLVLGLIVSQAVAEPLSSCWQERGRLLYKLADKIHEHSDEFAALEALVSCPADRASNSCPMINGAHTVWRS